MAHDHSGHESGGTRARIQEVALEMFVEQGYEKTSLREIADRLNVTKAALYYHFKTKEDILVSTVEDFLAELDELITWAQALPGTVEARSDVVRRYADLVTRRHRAVRFFHENQVTERRTLEHRFRNRMRTLYGLLAEPGAPVGHRVRSIAAMVSLHVCASILADEGYDDQEVRDATLEFALGVIMAGAPSAGAVRPVHATG